MAQLPPLEMGYRFAPTDKQIIKYLEGKVSGSSACDDLLSTVDLYGSKDPWEIFGDSHEEKKLYLFTPKVGKEKSSRNVGHGVWSKKEKDPIFGPRGQIIGHKRWLKYKRKEGGGGDDDDHRDEKWKMREYTLPDKVKRSRLKEESRDFALCVLKRKEGNNNLGCQDDKVLGYEELMESIGKSKPASRLPRRV